MDRKERDELRRTLQAHIDSGNYRPLQPWQIDALHASIKAATIDGLPASGETLELPTGPLSESTFKLTFDCTWGDGTKTCAVCERRFTPGVDIAALIKDGQEVGPMCQCCSATFMFMASPPSAR